MVDMVLRRHAGIPTQRQKQFSSEPPGLQAGQWRPVCWDECLRACLGYLQYPSLMPGHFMKLPLAVLVGVALVAAVSGCGGSSGGDTGTNGGKEVPDSSPVDLRPLSVSSDARIVDDLDREVLLRGANVNSLAEYWQGDPNHPPTIPLTDADWDAMEENGFSVVRLLISWSLVEPQRGVIDQAYLDAVDGYVTAAAQRGIYTVIDMHQDAYSSSIFTDDATECPEGTQPAKGWDGAPAWATITEGLSTCLTNNERNSSPAVIAAWNNFYDDTDGIRTQFAEAWGAVATRFAGRPEVAGYNILNEPEVTRPAGEITPLYEAMLVDVVEAIEAAEADASFRHIIIVEPAISTADPELGIVVPNPEAMGVSTSNVVAGPHNYAGAIGGGSIEGTNALFASVSDGLGIPVWIGEYGYFRRDDDTASWSRRFAADQDRLVWGGAWWQWRQGCGDPHSIGWGEPASGEVVQLNPVSCPGDVDLGPDQDFLLVLGRAYPRAAPGRITSLVSDPDTGAMTVSAEGGPNGDELVVWTPTATATHAVVVDGLADVVERTVGTGRLVTARVAGDGTYQLAIEPVAG